MTACESCRDDNNCIYQHAAVLNCDRWRPTEGGEPMRKTCANCNHKHLDRATDTPCTDCDGYAMWQLMSLDDAWNQPKVTKSTKSDPVNSPKHYTQGNIECIDAIQAAVTGLDGMDAVCTGHVVRYIWRWKYKNGLEDLRKCRYYLDRLIKMQEDKL